MTQKAKLTYSMLTSLDGYTEDSDGKFGWGAPNDDEVMSYINELAAPLGTYLYGRKMYETMVYWETAHEQPDMSQVALIWADQWKAAEKIVFSKTLNEISSARTRLERDFEPEKIRQLKAKSPHDISVDGTELAAEAIRAGLVDEIHQIICPVIVGGGKRFYPDGVQLDLKLFDERHFDSGVVILKYAVLNK